MTGKRERRWVGVIVFLAIMTSFLPTMIGAEEFGIIRGRILDKVTGEPLPGANVIVKGTQFGAASRIDGEYSILNIPPGSYQIVARMIGYESEYKDIEISRGETHQLDFELQESVIEMAGIVVTGTRTPRHIRDIPASVTVVAREEIEESYAKTVDDFLRRETGVQVRRPRGLTAACALGVRMRGTGSSSRVLILKDGVPLNTKFSGGVDFLPLNAMSTHDIERIEIVRGASSALYGSSAMGGVINIITRRAGIGLSGDISLEAGNFNTGIGSFGLRYGADIFALRFVAERKQTDGYKYFDPWDPDDESWRLPEMELNHISLGGDLWLGGSLLRVDFDNSQTDALMGTMELWDVYPETNKYRVGIEVPLWIGQETVFSLKGYYFDNEFIGTSYHFNPNTRELDIFASRIVRSNDDYGAMSQISTVLGNHHLVAGVDISGASVDHLWEFAPPFGDKKFEGAQSLYAVFVNNEMHLGERVILSAGLRHDRWENRDGRFYDGISGTWKEFPTVTESATSPRAGMVYKLAKDTRLRASLGTGFRAPPLLDMFRTGIFPPWFYLLGNPELKPERLDWSYDVGVDMQPHENFNISLTFYQSRLSNFMDKEMLFAGDPELPDWLEPGPMPVIRTINVGEVDIYGVEAGFEFRFSDKWSGFINHTYNVSKVIEHKKDPEVEGNYLPWTPRHIGVVGFTYDNPRLFTLSLDITSMGSRFSTLKNETEVVGFYMVNMKASRKLFKGMQVFANVENLTDERWKDSIHTNVGIPFNFMVGLGYTF